MTPRRTAMLTAGVIVAALLGVGVAAARASQRGRSTRAPYHLELGPVRGPIDVHVPSAFDASGKRVLMRVCEDPNNMPFSNAHGDGFENKLADMLGRDLGLAVSYSWLPERRGFVRNTLKLENCDVIMGIASASELVLPTQPYYRSMYMFVTRRDRNLRVDSFDDPALRHLRIGIHVTGGDDANPPAAQALAKRGLVSRIVGYPVYGDYDDADPPARLLEAVVRGAVDVAVVWGPLAGYYARRSRVPLRLAPVTPRIELPFLPFSFDISLGVRRGDTTWRNRLQGALDRHRGEIHQLLAAYGVPLDGQRNSAEKGR